MKKLKLFLALFIILSAAASAQSTRIKIISYLHPQYIIEQIKSQPYILYFAAGKFYFRIGNTDKAVEMFEKTAEFKPDFAPAYHNLAAVYYGNGEYNDALMEFKKAVEINPSYAKAHYSLGILYFELTEFDNAIDSFSKAVELQPDNANSNFDLAQSYVARFRKAEEDNSQDFDDLEKALFYLKKAEELQPGFAYALDNVNVIESIVEAREVLIGQS